MSKQSKPSTKNNTEQVKLSQKVEELTRALQLERADAVNVRRRAEQDKLRMSSYFKAVVIKELIPFMDNFELTMKHAPQELQSPKDNKWVEGLRSVYSQMWQILEGLGVKKIATLGQEFNPNLHEAVQMDPDAKGQKEIVVEEFRSGYILDDEVLRHAMVKVAMK